MAHMIMSRTLRDRGPKKAVIGYQNHLGQNNGRLSPSIQRPPRSLLCYIAIALFLPPDSAILLECSRRLRSRCYP